MNITLSGTIDLDDIKEIVRDNLEYVHRGGLTLYVPWDSWQIIMQDPQVQNHLAFMSPENLTNGKMTLYGATVAYYFPQLIDEVEN